MFDTHCSCSCTLEHRVFLCLSHLPSKFSSIFFALPATEAKCAQRIGRPRSLTSSTRCSPSSPPSFYHLHLTSCPLNTHTHTHTHPHTHTFIPHIMNIDVCVSACVCMRACVHACVCLSEIQPSGNSAELKSNSAKLKSITFNDRAALEQMVQERISSNKVMIFSKSGCPYCKKAKAAVEGAGESPTPHVDDTLIDTTYRYRALLLLSNARLWVIFFSRRNSV